LNFKITLIVLGAAIVTPLMLSQAGHPKAILRYAINLEQGGMIKNNY
jgi:hypothetical protein